MALAQADRGAVRESAPAHDLAGAARQLDYWLTVYRRTWRGSAVSSFVNPLLYVLAMGVLLGDYVRSDPDALDGAASYLAFVAPGLLAGQAMQTVFGETTYPVMSMVKWQRVYYGMIATPLSVRSVVLAQLAFVTFRVALGSAFFVLVMLPFGVFATWWGAVLAFAAQLLVGLAFAGPILGFSAGLRTESAFALLFRLAMIPMFLFSGAFFPLANLDRWMQWVAMATPLWHGVDLTRMLTLDTLDGSRVLVHLLYLVVLAVLGWVWAVRRLSRRLMT